MATTKRAALLAIAFIFAAGAAWAEQIDGAVLFSQNCAACHAESGPQRAPRLDDLRLLQPQFVADTLAAGV
ncbi:MAG TPA: hypothetical protein VNX61_07235, partial [Rhizomicrobium sp.]|nr:hypothetical protein [Rhizomicrobium sp.]